MEELELFRQFFDELAMPTEDPMHFFVSYQDWTECLEDMKYLKTKGYKFSQSMIESKK